MAQARVAAYRPPSLGAGAKLPRSVRGRQPVPVRQYSRWSLNNPAFEATHERLAFVGRDAVYAVERAKLIIALKDRARPRVVC